MNTLVYCTCCSDSPKALCVLGPREGLTVRRNKGRGNNHVVEMPPLEVLAHLAGSDDPARIAQFVNGLLTSERAPTLG